MSDDVADLLFSVGKDIQPITSNKPPLWPDGYYWARHADGSMFIVKRDRGSWYTCGLTAPMTAFNPEQQIKCGVHWVDIHDGSDVEC